MKARAFRILTLSAFIAKSEDGDEGIVAALVGNTWLPLVGADQARIDQLRPYAARIAQETGKRIELVRFIRGQLLEELSN